ncbi:MAG TPA: MFS transporter [Terracidiphilus sp.]|nr:MFS transporter [Terracidiphilus sp.]
MCPTQNNARRLSSILILSTGFSLTGTGTVMLGVLLPTLSQQWSLRDDTAGLLLFLQFFGSALGAVLTTLHRVRSLIAGYGLLVLSSGSLALAGTHPPFVTFFFFGLGLGMTMTSTSLLFSDRWSDDRAAKLEWLNFAWSAGATAGPILFLPFLRSADIRTLFWTLGGVFLFLWAWVILRERQGPAVPSSSAAQPASTRGVFLQLILLAMCSVGVEAALSGWLTTYSHRAGLKSLAGAAVATSLFWLGGMLSRLAFSTRLLAKIGRRATLQGAMWGVLASVAALIAATSPAMILAVAGVAGLCIGPLYPLLLSFLLERSARGWIFSVGGIGAAFFPWLTGLLSAHFHSLRLGLLAPCGAGLMMVILQSIGARPAKTAEVPAPVHL